LTVFSCRLIFLFLFFDSLSLLAVLSPQDDLFFICIHLLLDTRSNDKLVILICLQQNSTTKFFLFHAIEEYFNDRYSKYKNKTFS